MSHTDDTTDTDSIDTIDSNTLADLPYVPSGATGEIPDDDPTTRREDHPDDRHQVAGAAIDAATPRRPRPHADPVVETVRGDLPDGGEDALVMFDPSGADEWIACADDAMVALEGML